MSERIIGLDIGASSVKAAQVLRKGDGTYVVEKTGARPLPAGAVFDGRISEDERSRVSDTIKQLVEEEGFTARDAIYGLNSSGAVFMREVMIANNGLTPEDVTKALPLIIESKFPDLSPGDNEMSYSVLGEAEGEFGPELRVLVYSALKEYTTEVAQTVEAGGLNVVGADLNALAVL